ncbi:hypothetical protein BGZ65_007071 [Modicella reniformis]|uniref:Rho GDP-dissociation inhibitor n=1 Tax=Modicella reniformis TaxID=1440133 RepID=A0A9P6IJU1_9FUNG|nr:hypothetical protein BGZ65_007071 [Modicella reniformis]
MSDPESHQHEQQPPQNDEDDFDLSPTNGYKPGEKKSMNEYQTMDADDDALRRWKESLGVTSNAATSDDPHNVIVLNLSLEVAGRPDVVLDLTQSVEALKQHSFTIKEGIEYRIKVQFKVQQELVSGLKYVHVVKRKGLKGKYFWDDSVVRMYTNFAPEEAPSGMLARGHYDVKSKFIDDDLTVHKEWSWVSVFFI